MGESSTYLVRRIDDPWMISIVEMDVALVAAMVFFVIGVAFSHHLLGAAAAFLAGRQYHKLKAGKPRGAAKHWMYWYLPPFVTRLKATPPSHHTLMFG